MNRLGRGILVVDGGSSSLKFAVHEAGARLERRLVGKIDRIGRSGTTFHRADCNRAARRGEYDAGAVAPLAA
jgi:acetate kinase